MQRQEYMYYIIFIFALLLHFSNGHDVGHCRNVEERQKAQTKTGSTTICKSALHYSHFVVSINGTSRSKAAAKYMTNTQINFDISDFWSGN